MNIRDIKTAINGVLVSHGCRVYSNETDEGFERPAFFVEIVPVNKTRISPVYEEIEFSVEIHYEPLTETEEACLAMADKFDEWFSEPFPASDRILKPPDDIQHLTDDDITLYSSFTITTTRITNEDSYTEDPVMEDAELELNIRRD